MYKRVKESSRLCSKITAILMSSMLFLLSACGNTGCSNTSTEDSEVRIEGPSSMEEEADLSYEVPYSSPHI